MQDKLKIAITAKKTIKYIEKNIDNFPNSHIVLKQRILDSLYDILENIYRANINRDINIKKEIIVQIQMLNFYLKESLDKELISKKKFLSYSSHLLELHNMIVSWFKYEESE